MKRTFGVLLATFTLVSFGYSQSFFFADQDLEFEANVGQSEILVSLITGESDNNSYVFEKSSDGIEFQELSIVALDGQEEFDFIDNTPFVGKSYYRLVQKDANGGAEVIDIREVHYTTMDKQPLKVVSDMNEGLTELTVNSGANSSEELSLEVYDMKGHMVVNKVIQGGEFKINLDVKLNTGMYSVIVSAGDVEKSAKLLVY